MNDRSCSPPGELKPNRGKWGVWTTVLALAFIMALGLFLRCYQLSKEEPWADEITTLGVLDSPSLVDFFTIERVRDPNMSVLFCGIEYAWSRIFGISDFAVRPLPVLLSFLSIAVLFLIAARMYGTSASLLSALLFSLSYNCIYYGQEIRAYSLVGLLSLLSVYLFIRAVFDRRRTWWILHVIVNLLLAFTHTFAILLFAVEWLFLAIYRRRHVRTIVGWTAAHIAIVLLLGAWLLTGQRDRMVAFADWIPKADLTRLAMLFPNLAAGQIEQTVFVFPHYPPHNLAVACVPLAIAALFLLREWLMAGPATTSGTWTRREAAGLLTLWLFVPPLGLFLLAQITPCFLSRYILYCIFPYFILASAGVTSLPRGKLVLCGIVLAIYGYLASPVLDGPFRATKWREAGDYLNAEVRNTDKIICNEGAYDYSALKYFAPNLLYVTPNWHGPELFFAQDTDGMVSRLEVALTSDTITWILTPTYGPTAPVEAFLQKHGLSYGRRDFPAQQLAVYRVNKDGKVDVKP